MKLFMLLASSGIADAKPDDLRTLLSSFFNLWWGPMIGVVASASVLLGLWAGLRLILAHKDGDEAKIKAAKKFLTYIIIGIAVMFLLATIIPVLIGVLETWKTDQDIASAALLVVERFSLCVG